MFGDVAFYVIQATDGFSYRYHASIGEGLVIEARSLASISAEAEYARQSEQGAGYPDNSVVEMKLLKGTIRIPFSKLSTFEIDDSILLPRTEENISRLIKGDSFYFDGDRISWVENDA